MIKVKNINGKPEETPIGDFAVHSDNDYFYFFSTEEERLDFFTQNGIDYTQPYL
jgi:hypothetical protein